MARTKPLTERGSLFNGTTGGNLRKSVSDYANSLSTFYLAKELNEFTARFEWGGLPSNISADLLETMLYIKGQVCLFQTAGKYYILPFVYTGEINQYGIHTQLLPISFSGKLQDDDGKSFSAAKTAILYDIEVDESDDKDIAVVLRSNSGLYPSFTIPQIVVTDEIRSKLAENLILVRNNIILSQPMKYAQAANETQGKSLQLQVDNLLNDILNGNIVQVITGLLDFKDLNTETSNMKPQDLWQSYSSLDNLRMEYMGILNNGVFEKKERFLSDEVSGKQSVSKLLLKSALDRRLEFCKLANKFFGLNISVKVAEIMVGEEEKEAPDKRKVAAESNVNV